MSQCKIVVAFRHVADRFFFLASHRLVFVTFGIAAVHSQMCHKHNGRLAAQGLSHYSGEKFRTPACAVGIRPHQRIIRRMKERNGDNPSALGQIDKETFWVGTSFLIADSRANHPHANLLPKRTVRCKPRAAVVISGGNNNHRFGRSLMQPYYSVDKQSLSRCRWCDVMKNISAYHQGVGRTCTHYLGHLPENMIMLVFAVEMIECLAYMPVGCVEYQHIYYVTALKNRCV